MEAASDRVIAWVGTQVLPHEAEVRAWMRRGLVPPADRDDVIQEAYCRLAELKDVAHIADARAYLFQVVRNILREQVRRARIVRIETVTEIDALDVFHDEPSPERVAVGRRELERVLGLIAALPARCRRIVELRKIQGVPQREIARMLGVSENTVENDAARGLRLVLNALAADEEAAPGAANRTRTSDERRRKRKAD